MNNNWVRRWVPLGSIYERNGRYWYVLPMPEGGRKAFPLSPRAGLPATTSRSDAGPYARKIYKRFYEAAPAAEGMDGLVEKFREHEASRCCPEHLAVKVKTVKDFLARMHISEPGQITATAVEDYMDYRLGLGKSRKTVTNERGCIGRFCKFLAKRERIAFNPVTETDRPRVNEDKDIVHFTRPELDTLIAAAVEREMWPVVVAAYTGLRRAELMRLRKTDYQRGAEGPTLAVRMRKGRQWMVKAVPVASKLAAVLDAMPATAGELMFPAMSRKQWADYLDPLKKLVPRLARKGGGWQDFRRTIASLILQDDPRKIASVSKLLRHSNIATTSRAYAHLTPESSRADVELL